MINESIFKVKKDKYQTLNQNITCDLLIIGGGITGISTLYNFKGSNLKTVLVEQNEIGGLTTMRSTGKLTFLQNNLMNIKKIHGSEKLKLYIESQVEAINGIKTLINRENLKCDLRNTESIIYTNKEEEINELKKLEKFLNKNNIKTKKVELEFVKYKYAFKVDNTYIFNPSKFVYQLAHILKSNIYENTKIIKIKKEKDYYLSYTNKYYIKSKYIVLATHYPSLKNNLFLLKNTYEKSYISASSFKTKDISLISYSNPFISSCSYNDKLIYLSNSTDISNFTSDKKNYEELLKKLNDLNLKPSNLWSNIDIMSNDYIPFIGKISKNIYISSSYNTWGLTNGFLAGIIIHDLILNKQSKYENLFDPKRKNVSLIVNSFKTLKNTFKAFLKGFKNGEKTCTHLGCKLVYNEIDNTFDCPCHASRFAKNGNVINGPAIKKIT